MMLVEETTVPLSAFPVATFKDHMRMGSGFSDDGVQDGVLEGFLRAAVAAIEARTGKITISRTFSLSLTAWRDTVSQPLPLAPVTAIIDVAVFDRHGMEATIDSDAYRLIEDAHRPHLAANGASLPRIPQSGVARIHMSAGFGPDWQDLPADLAQAILMLAAHYYEFRFNSVGSGQSMPYGVTSLIERNRNIRLFSGGRL